MPNFGDFKGPRNRKNNLRAQRILKRREKGETLKYIGQMENLTEGRVSTILFYAKMWDSIGLKWRIKTKKNRGN